MSKQHKWANEIKAWADGAEIEFRSDERFEWEQSANPSWFTADGYEYRIKPKTRLAVIDGVEHELPEALPCDGTLRSVFYVDVFSRINDGFDTRATVPGRCFASREDAELFARADKALRGVL